MQHQRKSQEFHQAKGQETNQQLHNDEMIVESAEKLDDDEEPAVRRNLISKNSLKTQHQTPSFLRIKLD